MGAIDMNMDEIETMLTPEKKLELADAQEHAQTVRHVDGVSVCQ